jgi:hypothetical protein
MSADGFFDLESPKFFFGTVKHAVERLADAEQKRTEDLMYVLMGLTHLREWIAPGYSHTQPATTPEQRFYNEIYSLDSFKLIQALCNRSKHLKPTSVVTMTTHEPLFDDWHSVDDVCNFDLGPVTDYFVNGKNLLDVVHEVLSFYESRWFNGCK